MGCERQPQGEARAAFGEVGCVDASVVAAHDAESDRKPQARALAHGLKGEEGVKNTLIPEDVQMSAQQRQIIEEMRLPDTLKDLLIENNNSRIYEALGVTRFQEYIGSYIANTILNVVAYVMMLIVVYLLIKVLVSWLDIVTRLPILSGMNKIAGAILGGVQGLLFFWIAALLLTAFATTAWGSFLLMQIETSTWLSVLYHINPISRIALGILHGILT